MWRYVSASEPGTAHLVQGIPCQDAHAVDSSPTKIDEVFWAVVADGAGSASCAARGAQIACECISRRISRWFSIHRSTGMLLDEGIVAKWVDGAHRRLSGIAASEERPLRDFACTLLGIAVDHERAVCFQIGDGAIVACDEQSEYHVVFWPANGEYVNTTYFLTDESYRQTLAIQVLPYAPEEVALFTDGLQPLALHLASRTVHVPFFAPMFCRLRQEMSGRSATLESGLHHFLSSAAVNQRTEDDRTLVLATREPALE